MAILYGKQGLLCDKIWCHDLVGCFKKSRLYALIIRRCLAWYDAVQWCINPLPDDKILDWSKFKHSADDNFEFDVNNRKFSKLVENTG